MQEVAGLPVELRDHREQRQKEERRRHEVRQEDADADALAELPRKPRERVTRRDREHERDQHDGNADDRRVAQPRRVLRFVEKETGVGERRSLVEPVRRMAEVVEVALLLESGDHHHVEREGEHDRERADDQIRQPFLAEPPKHGIHLLGHLRAAREDQHPDRDDGEDR